jgi:hypothetical protein
VPDRVYPTGGAPSGKRGELAFFRKLYLIATAERRSLQAFRLSMMFWMRYGNWQAGYERRTDLYQKN